VLTLLEKTSLRKQHKKFYDLLLDVPCGDNEVKTALWR